MRTDPADYPVAARPTGRPLVRVVGLAAVGVVSLLIGGFVLPGDGGSAAVAPTPAPADHLPTASVPTPAPILDVIPSAAEAKSAAPVAHAPRSPLRQPPPLHAPPPVLPPLPPRTASQP